MSAGDVGIDYAWSHPDPAAVKAAGYSFVFRYLSNDPSKDLSPDERDRLQALGLGIGLVWETTAGRLLQGAAAGAEDGKRANALATALGFPADLPLYYACDTAVSAGQFDAIEAYLRAAAGAGRAAGIYGECSVVDAMLERGAAVKGWQTVAWSGGRLSTAAHLYQRSTPTRGLAGGGFDENIALQDDYGVWSIGPAPQPQEVEDMDVKQLEASLTKIFGGLQDGGATLVGKADGRVFFRLLDHSLIWIVGAPGVKVSAGWVKPDGTLVDEAGATKKVTEPGPAGEHYEVPDEIRNGGGIWVQVVDGDGRATVQLFSPAAGG